MNLEYTRATGANTDQVNIKLETSYHWYWYYLVLYSLEVVEQGMSKVTFLWPTLAKANRQATALAARSTGCTGSDKVQIQNCHHSFG